MRLLKPTRENIALCARAIRDGGLVVVPTETVYGLAVDALNAEAVSKIFLAKGRPPENPLIVHIANKTQGQRLVSQWPQDAESLANRFWPGPLTLVLPKTDHVPAITTGGLDSVGLRMPDNDICRRLIEAAARPLAAPSANRFMALSPTRPEHFDAQLMEHVDFALDGGPCSVGIESTVLELIDGPVLLRPGAISKHAIEQVLGTPVAQRENGEVRAPGMYPKHYSPRTPVKIVQHASARAALVFGQARGDQIQMPPNATDYAAWLYAALHLLDHLGSPTIEIEAPPQSPEWDGIWDRIQKMAHK